MKLAFFAAASALIATGAVAAPPADGSAAERAATAAPAQAASANRADEDAQDDKKICRTERATGSLTRRTRVCLTAAQWREVNSKTYRGVTDMQGSASGGQAVSNNPGAGG